MKKSLTWSLGMIIIGVIFATVLINTITTYRTAYTSLYEAAGVEAYGCANITTGLLDIEDIDDLENGNRGEEIGQKLNWTTDHKDIFENQFIISLEGEILALDDNLREQGFEIGDSFYMDPQAIQELVDTNHATYSEIYEYGGMERISGYAPIFSEHDSTKDIVAVSVIDFNADIVSERTWNVVQDGILSSFIPLVLAAVITLYLIRRKTKPITKLIEQTKRIADGDIRKRKTIVTTQDEIGDLAQHIQQMTDNLREVITTIQNTANDLVQNTNHTATSMNEMQTMVGQISYNMEEVATETSDGLEMTQGASTVLTDLAGLIGSSSETAQTSVKSATAAMDAAKVGLQKVNVVVDQMNAINESSQDTKEMMGYVNDYTNEIQQITETITGLAEQTNLLALNAAIEAARAGEQGKGFAVVANEVRNLAEQSNKEASEVENIISKITSSIQKTIESMEESHQKVETGERTVNETGEALENIRFAVNEIVDEINDLSQLTEEQAKMSDHIVEQVSHLQHANENMAENAQEVSAAAEESTASIESVAERSSNLAERSNELNQVVNRFKL